MFLTIGGPAVFFYRPVTIRVDVEGIDVSGVGGVSRSDTYRVHETEVSSD